MPEADAKTLAAMAHPLRRRLLRQLSVNGPATASQLAERTDQLVGNVSHHLKVLAECGLIELAPELAKDKRERWWRSVRMTLSWSMPDAEADPAEYAVATAAESVNLDQHISWVRDWIAARDTYAKEWSEASAATDGWSTATPEELADLTSELIGVITRFCGRDVPDDGRHREPVFVFAHAAPGRL
ncbi:winged helix-turn-helix domain-containing protein [Labedaea rhizosphaerae]|uniref:ArsR family transcriptional regulator n=1 Tax=Labedaea rhizosphaerae TaxID=598644 RepID=A0A4R6SEK0_LABRH|nr:winged helix-turn-helix domain-containing protein [Labedaea rhizosphaerae]TDP97476.1 ArsR family transcriptional regulator [Labedaea rhizosphaerae]